jgi:hypothetical protein
MDSGQTSSDVLLVRSARIPGIIHKMGHRRVFLTVEQIAFGVDKLLKLVDDRAAVESRRPPHSPDGLSIRTAAGRNFRNGVRFQLNICSRPPTPPENELDANIERALATITSGHLGSGTEEKDLGIDMHWWSRRRWR